MNNEIDFSKKYEYDVEIYLDGYGTLGSGTLHFGGGVFPHVNLDAFGQFIRPDGEPHLKAKTKGGEKFTLTNCTYQDYTIHSDLIVCGDIASGSSEIIVKYADISDWFMCDQYVKGNLGENLNWTTPPPQILANIESENYSFSLRSEIYSSLTKHREERTIHEHVNFVFTRSDGEFSLSEIKNKPLELSSLLSIFIAYPISISSIWVKGSSGYPVPLYYPTFKKADRDFDENVFWRNALISRSTLDGCWQSILEKYYNSKFRKVQWSRLSGMQRHEGFWEYKVLGYVSLLDSYTSRLTKEDGIKPTNKKAEKIDVLLGALDSIKHPLTPEQLAEVRSLIESALPKQRTLSFTEKYNYLIDNTDTDIIKIINLSNEDFKLIKQVRDIIAHGDAVDLIEYPYERIHSTTQKLTLLLTYHATVDFGIATGDFIQSLYNTINILSYNKGLDLVHLRRTIEPDSFLKVSPSLFDKITSAASFNIYACFAKSPNGVLEYSEKYSRIHKEWLNQKNSGRYSFEDIFGVAKERIKNFGTAYLECGEKIKELYGVFIILDE
ncbi:HEPN domain-containing protein [Pseudomonas sp. MWU318]|uniref:ApeA N-terminal domain 1-containing protein n=1 Tax=Pseudomonas sp. MWU318 TaxID=2802569 RepID=UPI0019277922|nr:HEPN domain-containing protein [Pseudomonas sp. MWU318]